MDRNNVAPFIMKLYQIVDNPQTDNCIRWNRSGDGFLLVDSELFCKNILPQYYKHNILTTFIRQLNLYGFKKVVNLESGVVVVGESHIWQYVHPKFRRDNINLLLGINRKLSNDKNEYRRDLIYKNSVHPLPLVDQLEQLKLENKKMAETIENLQEMSETLLRQNKILFAGNMAANNKAFELQSTVEKILKFLASIYSPEFIKSQVENFPVSNNHTLSRNAITSGSMSFLTNNSVNNSNNDDSSKKVDIDLDFLINSKNQKIDNTNYVIDILKDIGYNECNFSSDEDVFNGKADMLLRNKKIALKNDNSAYFSEENIESTHPKESLFSDSSLLTNEEHFTPNNQQKIFLPKIPLKNESLKFNTSTINNEDKEKENCDYDGNFNKMIQEDNLRNLFMPSINNMKDNSHSDIPGFSDNFSQNKNKETEQTKRKVSEKDQENSNFPSSNFFNQKNSNSSFNNEFSKNRSPLPFPMSDNELNILLNNSELTSYTQNHILDNLKSDSTELSSQPHQICMDPTYDSFMF